MDMDEQSFYDSMFELLNMGAIEVSGIDENGEEYYRLTEKGKQYYEELMRKNGNKNV